MVMNIEGSEAASRALSDKRQLDLVLQYARAGLPVFPVRPDGSKSPYTPHGKNDATTDARQIREWWTHWPNALASIPTGSSTGLLVLDVDGPAGRRSLADLLAKLGLERPEDLTPCIVETPRSKGLHLYFRLHPGEQPRTRAGDISPGLDTRGEGGSIIAPGNRLPDGREYRCVGPSTDLPDAAFAPVDLVYLATFNNRERAAIADDADLSSAMQEVEPSAWRGILDAHRERERARIMAHLATNPPDGDAMRRQALADLDEAVSQLAALMDGRRNALFTVACRLAKYVAHRVLTEGEVLAALEAAAAANGTSAKHGRSWIVGTIRRGLAYGANDPLPPVAREFIEGAA